MKKKLALILILAGGFILRIIGIDWGLPQGVYFHSYPHYQDEAVVIKSLRAMNIEKFDLNPKEIGTYGRGSLSVYTVGAWLKVASIFKFVNATKSYDFYKKHPLELRKLYVAGRLMTVMFGVLSVLLVYFVGKLLYTEKVGLLSAFFLSILPAHIVFSHYIATDVMLSLWALLVLLFCHLIITKGDLKWYILCGLTIGLSAATKYNSGLILFVFILAHFLRNGLVINKKILIGLFLVVVGFAIGTPCNFLYFNDFLENFKICMSGSYMDGAKSPFECFERNSGWVYYTTTALKYGMGTPLHLLSLVGIIYALIKRTKQDWLFLVWIITFTALLGTSTWRVARWIVPLTPFYLLFVSRFYFEVAANNKVLKYVLASTLILTSIYTASYSIAYVKGMAQKDVRIEASDWIEKNIPAGSSIGVIRDPCFTNPTVVIMEYYYKENDPCYVKRNKKYQIVDFEYSYQKFRNTPVDYITISDYEYFPYLKLKEKYPHPEIMPVLVELFEGKNYTKVKTFTRKLELFGFVPIGGFYPHDWRWPFSTIVILKKI